jgi:hypothetical protein
MTAPWTTPDGVDAPETILDAIDSPRWWGPWFSHGDWGAWKVALAAMFGLPLDDEQLALFRQCTGRSSSPTEQVREAWMVCGRRGGKTRVMATTACWLAAFYDWRGYLAPSRSERATIMVLAADRRQARTAMRYIRSLLVEHPLLKGLVERETGEEIQLNCGTSIEVGTASFRSTRGYSVAAVLADEVSFWRDDDSSANPAAEIFTALRPSMATLPGSMLMVATTPYSKRGLVYETFKRHYGKDGDPILIWRAPTRQMNSSVSQAVIDEEYERDPSAAAAEFGAEFRSDLENYIPPEVVDAVVIPHRFELPRVNGVSYVAFVDPSGGSSDSMTIAVAHRDRAGRAVLDAVRERRPPFSPDQCVNEFVGLLAAYGVRKVHGDRYAGEWPREAFRKYGVAYEPSEKTKSQIYVELLPILNAGRCELLDIPRLVSQLCSLERRTARGGRDSIDHPPHAHDDVANAVAGACVLAGAKASWFSSEGAQRIMAESNRRAHRARLLAASRGMY